MGEKWQNQNMIIITGIEVKNVNKENLNKATKFMSFNIARGCTRLVKNQCKLIECQNCRDINILERKHKDINVASQQTLIHQHETEFLMFKLRKRVHSRQKLKNHFRSN